MQGKVTGNKVELNQVNLWALGKKNSLEKGWSGSELASQGGGGFTIPGGV